MQCGCLTCIYQVSYHAPMGNILGRNLRRLRLEKGLSQAALAKLIGVKPPRISTWETGAFEPTGRKRRDLVRALGCSYNDLEDENAPSTVTAASGAATQTNQESGNANTG